MDINPDFYNKLLEIYFTLKIPFKYEKLSKIGNKITWYLADDENLFVSAINSNNKNIIEIDIKSDYPSICNCIFDPQSEFIKTMNNIQNKEKKNIFISTTLESNQLRYLALISKLIIFGIVIECTNDIILFEIKKDSCLLLCDNNTVNVFNNINSSKLPFTKFIIDNNFKFNINRYNIYYRINKTSTFIDNENNLIIKGTYKHVPEFILNQLKDILINNIINKNVLLKIYSYKFLNILLKNHINDFIKYYYMCSNKKILSSMCLYNHNNNDIDPYSYLKLFIYPAILCSKT